MVIRLTKHERTIIEELIEAVGRLSAAFEAHGKSEERYLQQHYELHRVTDEKIDKMCEAINDLNRTRDRVRGAIWGWGALFMAVTTVLSVIAALIGKGIGI